MTLTKQQVLDWLSEVPDPEIPSVSVIDLGIITGVTIHEEEHKLHVVMTPTFSGCPAVAYMRGNMEAKIAEKFLELAPNYDQWTAEVTVDYNTQWNSNRITEQGLQKLKAFGLTPPKKYEGELDLATLSEADCPFCGSKNTTMHSSFGPTLCRAIHYCFDCLQGFEQFKPL